MIFSKKTIVSIALIVSLLGSGLCAPFAINAQNDVDNLRILYQGILNDSDGLPVEDGNYNIKFTIYDSEEKVILWEEKFTFYNAVFVKEGKFKVVLGRENSIQLNLDESPFWLSLAIGELTEEKEIIWGEEIKPRKKIMTLPEFLKEEGLEYPDMDSLTEEEWQSLFKTIEERIEGKPNLILLFNIEDLIKMEASNGLGSTVSGVLQNLMELIVEKLSEIMNNILEIRNKIGEISLTLEKIILILNDIKYKVDTIYQVLVVDKGLAPSQEAGPGFIPQPKSETPKEHRGQKVERLVFKKGESLIRVFDDSVKEESLVFVNFIDAPKSDWRISEKIPGYSFNINLDEPAYKDLLFDYWIINKGETGGETGGETSTTVEEENIENPQPEEEPVLEEEPILEEPESEEEPEEEIVPDPEEEPPLLEEEEE